jgi:hypothetical protein
MSWSSMWHSCCVFGRLRFKISAQRPTSSTCTCVHVHSLVMPVETWDWSKNVSLLMLYSSLFDNHWVPYSCVIKYTEIKEMKIIMYMSNVEDKSKFLNFSVLFCYWNRIVSVICSFKLYHSFRIASAYNYSVPPPFLSVELKSSGCKLSIFSHTILEFLSMEIADEQGLLVVNLENCVSSTGMEICVRFYC